MIDKTGCCAILVFMKNLHIYPTSRALRAISSQLKDQEGFLPSLMRMDEFEKRAVLLENKSLIDPVERILLLREAAFFENSNKLNLRLELIHFFTRSDALFRFFEELAAEKVDFDMLRQADAYAEFDEHLQILQTLLDHYRALLEQKGLTDKAFIASSYAVNTAFVQNYTCIEIHVEGYLSRFEFELIDKISQKTKLILHFATSSFNRKMQERFEAYGIALPPHHRCVIDFSAKQLISGTPLAGTIEAEVIEAEERYEQIALAFVKIEEMVQSGINPEKIVLVLPDEQLKEGIRLYDAHHNLNFAMGYDYSKQKPYKMLAALYGYWQSFEKEAWFLLERYGMDTEKIQKINPNTKSRSDEFFVLLETMGLLDCPMAYASQLKEETKQKENEKVYEAFVYFTKIFSSYFLSAKEWLFLWMKTLSTIVIDDVQGGKITVMGLLETRGISFEGVVIVDFNEGVVPASTSKDQFLNSSVRAFAGLPTKSDRESLQKQYYKQLLEQAKQAVVLYGSSDNKLPSKFLFELGIGGAQKKSAQLDILYDTSSPLMPLEDPVVKSFDASSFVWSASRLKTYLDCKRKYYYRYIRHIEPKKEEELNEGAFLHLLLEHAYAHSNAFYSVESLEGSLHCALDELLTDKDAKTEYQKLLWREKLKGFIREEIGYFNENWRIAAKEMEIKGKISGLNFQGRIDRLDQREADVWVLDYKTGSTKEANKTSNLETLNDFQMSIYYYLLSPSYNNIKLSYVKVLQEGQREEIAALEEKNALLIDRIAQLIQTKNFIAKKCEDLQRCNYCEFALMCERGAYL